MPILWFLACILIDKVETFTVQKIISYGQINPDFSNRKITEQYLASFGLTTRVQCIILCNQDVNCKSFQWLASSQKCVLFGQDFLDVVDAQTMTEKGWLYYHNVKGKVYNGGPCAQFTEIVCNHLCMQFVSIPSKSPYSTAKQTCADINAEIIKVDRALVQSCMEILLANHPGATNVYIQGIGDMATGRWYYEDGQEFAYFNWNGPAGQPDNTMNDETSICSRQSVGYKWHDVGNKLAVGDGVICQF